jgi:hypothetical protein
LAVLTTRQAMTFIERDHQPLIIVMSSTATIKTTALNYSFNKRQKTLDNINLEVERAASMDFWGLTEPVKLPRYGYY